MSDTPDRQFVQIQDVYEDVNITPTNPPYDTRSVTGPTLDPNRNNYFTPPVLADERKKRKASQDREYSTSIGKKDQSAPAEKKVIIDLNSSTLEGGAVGGLGYRETGEQVTTVENDSDSSSTDSDSSDNSQVDVGMDLDATFAELSQNPEKRAAVDRVFTEIGVPPVTDWVTRWELQKASQIQESKRIADMATAANDPKNLVKPVLKDPKLVLAPGRLPPISNPNLPGPSSADQFNPPFNNQSSGEECPMLGGGMVGTTILVDGHQLNLLKRMQSWFCHL